MITLTYQRGEPISLDLVLEGAGAYNPADLTVEMRLKAAINGAPPPKSAPVMETFGVTFTAAAGAEPAYWRGTIDAATSSTLPAKLYVTDAAIKLAGTIIAVTDPVAVKIAESVTPQ